MSLEAYLLSQLDALRAQDRFRDPEDAHARDEVRGRAAAEGLRFLDATSNDYLGLASAAWEAAAPPVLLGQQAGPRGAESVSRETVGGRAGAGAARLVQGTWPEHEGLERELADWVGMSAALLFTSGYAANLGVVAALVDAESVVVSDQLNHASIVDGCRLSRGRTVVMPHLDARALDAALADAAGAARRWVVTESYFSMDGDGPDLGELRAICSRHRAFLIVDEAHALGVYGPGGAGRCAEAGVVPDVLLGTLGKSVGTQGAFVAGSQALRAFLWNRARSFVFSTATSPALCARTQFHVQLARAADGARTRVLRHAARLRESLLARGIPTAPRSFGPVVAVLVGGSAQALALATQLRSLGALVQPIRPPTVPEGQARIRITVNASWSDEDIERLVEIVARGWEHACLA